MRLKAAFLLGALLAGPATAQTVTVKPLSDSAPPAAALSVHVEGRGALSEDGHSADYSWPLSGAGALFSGDEVTFRIDDTPGRLSIIIDDKPVGDLAHPGKAEVTVRDIPPAPDWTWTPGGHYIKIIKYNESLGATGHIIGIYGKTYFAPPMASNLDLEVIGDSWTAGYGNISDSHFCSAQKLSDTTDARQTWGAFVARDLRLDLFMTAYSGIGIVRNYDGTAPGHTMPAIYNDATFSDKRPNDVNRWFSPALIIISLGGNDFETALSENEKWQTKDALRADFVATYEAFLRDLRRQYPKVGLVLMNYGEDEVVAATAKIIAQLNSEGENHIATYTAAGPFEQTGCDWHLNVNDYNKIAAGLTDWLRQHPDLWHRR